MIQNDNQYTPFQNNGTNYIPFQDGIIFESQGYYNNRMPKCEFCGKPAQVANCHSHEDWCPYSCDYNNEVPVGNELILLIIIPIYLLIKKFKNAITFK